MKVGVIRPVQQPINTGLILGQATCGNQIQTDSLKLKFKIDWGVNAPFKNKGHTDIGHLWE